MTSISESKPGLIPAVQNMKVVKDVPDYQNWEKLQLHQNCMHVLKRISAINKSTL